MNRGDILERYRGSAASRDKRHPSDVPMLSRTRRDTSTEVAAGRDVVANRTSDAARERNIAREKNIERERNMARERNIERERNIARERAAAEGRDTGPAGSRGRGVTRTQAGDQRVAQRGTGLTRPQGSDALDRPAGDGKVGNRGAGYNDPTNPYAYNSRYNPALYYFDNHYYSRFGFYTYNWCGWWPSATFCFGWYWNYYCDFWGNGWYNPWWFGRRFNYPWNNTTVIYVDDGEPDVVYVDGGAAMEERVVVDEGEQAMLEPAATVAPGESPESLQFELNRASDYYLTLGDRAFREGRYGDAVHFYAKAVEFAPDVGILYLILSDGLFATGDYHYAAYCLRKALELDPALAENVVDKHSFYADPADFDRQLQVLERYLEDHFLDNDARLVLAANYLFGQQADKAYLLLSNAFSQEVVESPAGAQLFAIAQAIEDASPASGD